MYVIGPMSHELRCYYGPQNCVVLIARLTHCSVCVFSALCTPQSYRKVTILLCRSTRYDSHQPPTPSYQLISHSLLSFLLTALPFLYRAHTPCYAHPLLHLSGAYLRTPTSLPPAPVVPTDPPNRVSCVDHVPTVTTSSYVTQRFRPLRSAKMTSLD